MDSISRVELNDFELDPNYRILSAIERVFQIKDGYKIVRISRQEFAKLESNEDVGEDEDPVEFETEKDRIDYVCEKFNCTARIDGDDVVFTLMRH